MLFYIGFRGRTGDLYIENDITELSDLPLTIQHCKQFQTFSYNLRTRRRKFEDDSTQKTNESPNISTKRPKNDAIDPKKPTLSEKDHTKSEKVKQSCKICNKLFTSLLMHLSKGGKDCKKKGCEIIFERLLILN